MSVYRVSPGVNMTKLKTKPVKPVKQHQLYRSKLTKEQRRALATVRKHLRLVYKERKIKNADKHIDRLFKSVYHGQFNDYVMVKIKGCDVPVDAPLGPVVKELVSRGFWPWSNDANVMFDINDSTEQGYIILASNPTSKTAKGYDKPRNELIDHLVQVFQQCNIKVIRRKPPFDPNENRRHLKNMTSLPNMLVIAANGPDTVSLQFQMSYLPSVLGALNISANKTQVLPGGIHVPDFLKLYDELPLPKQIEPCEFYGAKCHVNID